MKLNVAPGCKPPLAPLLICILGLLPLAASALPDLVINVPRAKATVEFRRRAFSSSDCAYVEGCVWQSGGRKLLLLDVGVINIGLDDLVIGDPNERPDLFVWSPCHEHYHMRGLALYRLLTPGGRQVAKSYKQGFCLRDDHQKLAQAEPAKYTCDFQGISAGWQDIYDKSLDCQWVDITGVPPGAYYLEITVNPYRVFGESNYKNNRVVIPIHVPKKVHY